jgi:hypothetical protein
VLGRERRLPHFSSVCIAELALGAARAKEDDLRRLVVGQVSRPVLGVHRHPRRLALGALEDGRSIFQRPPWPGGTRFWQYLNRRLRCARSGNEGACHAAAALTSGLYSSRVWTLVRRCRSLGAGVASDGAVGLKLGGA